MKKAFLVFTSIICIFLSGCTKEQIKKSNEDSTINESYSVVESVGEKESNEINNNTTNSSESSKENNTSKFVNSSKSESIRDNNVYSSSNNTNSSKSGGIVNSKSNNSTQSQVFSAGQECVSPDGSYSIIINSVRQIPLDAINPFLLTESDKQAVIVEYTYQNISSSESVYVYDGNFLILDATGVSGRMSTLNISTSSPYANLKKNPVSLPIGGKCDANGVYLLYNESNTVKVCIRENAFSSKYYAIFNMNVSK